MYKNLDRSYDLKFLDYKDKIILEEGRVRFSVNEDDREDTKLDASGSKSYTASYTPLIIHESSKDKNFLNFIVENKKILVFFFLYDV